jgi:hypothetical protein
MTRQSRSDKTINENPTKIGKHVPPAWELGTQMSLETTPWHSMSQTGDSNGFRGARRSLDRRSFRCGLLRSNHLKIDGEPINDFLQRHDILHRR